MVLAFGCMRADDRSFASSACYILIMRQAEKEKREFQQTFRKIEEDAKKTDRPLVEPSDDEKRNGWDAISLTAYLDEQSAAQSLRISPGSAMRRQPVTRANNKYSPTKHWRR